MKDGSTRNRSGDPYKPSVIRDYSRSVRLYIKPELGSLKLSSLSRVDVQDFADRLLARGLDPSSVKNILMPLWAIALYAGLRRGELWALRWEDVDFDAGVIHVRRSWDVHEGEIEPKSGAGVRRVPIATVLRTFLLEQKLRNGGAPSSGSSRTQTTSSATQRP